MDEKSLLWLPTDPFVGNVGDLFKAISLRYCTEHGQDWRPGYVESSKMRGYRLFYREGVDEERSHAIQRIYGVDSLVSYRAFNRKFYGIELPVGKIMNEHLFAAKHGHEADKQALTIIGPPGGGKSDFVEHLKALYRMAEPVPFLAGSPVHANPLSLLFVIHRVARGKSETKSAADIKKIAAEIIESLDLVNLIDWELPAVKEIVERRGITCDAAGLAEICNRVNPGDKDFVELVVLGFGLPRVIVNNVGKPDPYTVDRVLGEYDKANVIEDLSKYPIDNFWFDEDGNGIVDVAEVQPVNFDLATFIGQRNIGVMGKFQSLDPRSVELIGAFCRSNRGLVILTEGLKNPVEAQRILLEALQGHRIALPQPMQGDLFWEGWCIIHSNEGEYVKFCADRVNEPFGDRFQKVFFTYPTEASEARRISEKMWKGSDFSRSYTEGGVHIEPILWDYEGMIRVASYVEDDPEGRVSLMAKIQAYNGRTIRQKGMGTVVDVRDLRAKATWREGMQGISPRETAKSLVGAMAAEALQRHALGKSEAPCVTTLEFREKFLEVIKISISDNKQRERIAAFVKGELEEWRRRELSKVVKASFVEEFKTHCQEAFERYIDFAMHKCKGTTPGSGYGRVSQKDLDDFLRLIESDPDFGITTAQADKFRQEILAAYTQWVMEHGSKNVPYTIHEGLKNCIERHVLRNLKDVARILTSETALSDEDKRKVAGAKDRLITQHGFCPYCADQLLLEVQRTRDFLKE